MSYVKRQELFKNVNPLLKKYKYDGHIPPQYIPADKRAKISSYMGRSSFQTGSYHPDQEVGIEQGLQTLKQTSEKKTSLESNYTKSLSQRISDGNDVKSFHNKQRIYYGREEGDHRQYRKNKRGGSSKTGHYKKEPYSKMIQEREEIKENTNKVNCFVDENQPEFISTMSRTMDAFDLRMQTFGGIQEKAKMTHFDKFIQEKRGFIRLSNGYQNNDPSKVNEEEYQSPLIGSGPAFETSYDNKYKQNTSFASDQGRYKNPLNINKHTSEALGKAEKIMPMYNLKDSNIKFVHPELVESPATINQASIQSEDASRTGSKQVMQRSNTSQKQQRPEPRRTETNSTMMNKTMDFKSYSSNLSPRGSKPYDMWKQQIVSNPDHLDLDTGNKILFKFDQSNKNYLTTAKGGPHQNDYKTVKNKVHHDKDIRVDAKHIDIDNGVQKLMKTTTFQIGKEQEKHYLDSTARNNWDTKTLDEGVTKGDTHLRRAEHTMSNNPNRTLTVGFGFGAEKGTSEHQVVHRNQGYYKHYFKGDKNDQNPQDMKDINQDRADFNLSNKFQYGHDQKGGIVSRPEPTDPRHIKECLDGSAVGHVKAEENKEYIERQNFTIQHDKQLQNTKPCDQIGGHKGKGIDNIIDQEDLKRSHVPFKHHGDKSRQDRSYASEMKKSAVQSAQNKIEYHHFKLGSTCSKVPFAPERRNRVERTYQKFDKHNGFGASVSKTNYSWKVPTYDLNPL